MQSYVVEVLIVHQLLLRVERFLLGSAHLPLISRRGFGDLFTLIAVKGRRVLLGLLHLKIILKLIRIGIDACLCDWDHSLLESLLMRTFCSASTLVRLSSSTVYLSSSAFFSLR